MVKFIEKRPEWIAASGVADIYSVSNCISEDFCDYINHWKHNGYWFFDSPGLIGEVAALAGIDISRGALFYYEAHELEYNQEREEWQTYEPEEHFPVAVEPAISATLEGYDVVSFFVRSSPECSPLSCNGLANSVSVNRHCLFDTFAECVSAIESGAFKDGEPGPLRIFAVHTVSQSAV